MNDVPMGTIDEDGKIDGVPFDDFLKNAMAECEGSSAVAYGRERPYNGQPHTPFGIRGAAEVKGLTFRDVMDCFVGGLLECCHETDPELYELKDQALHEYLYKVKDLNAIDPGAWVRNALVRMEKMMGIYPNVPKLESNE